MKKTILIAVVALLFGYCGQSHAQVQQDCDEVVRAAYDYGDDVLDIIPADKYNYVCNYSKAAFFFADELPANAVVYNYSELFDKKEQVYVSATVDIASLFNFYRFSYIRFQVQHSLDTDIFFRLPEGSEHTFLALHNYSYIARASRDLDVEYDRSQQQ
ncbi:MAG: hypothetical protein HUK17_06580 [Bacteroidales bacterium]|nr:hypothetical protein [Bacteroidales bacterium]